MMQRIVLVIGSGPNAAEASAWPSDTFTDIVAINNAWQIRPDWDYAIHPEDFPDARRPQAKPRQQVITAADYVPIQNRFGGFVFAGGTMAFTAGYWALGTLRPDVIAFIGCDMVYPATGQTHFYGTGTRDPLRADVTLQSLEAKSARMLLLAAQQGCACVNLSEGESRLVFPRADLAGVTGQSPLTPPVAQLKAAEAREQALGYDVPSGRYWEQQDRFDAAALAEIDHLWLEAFASAAPQIKRAAS